MGISQVTASGSDTLATLVYLSGTYPAHCPVSVTDASGQTTTYQYNSPQGQVTKLIPPIRVSAGLSGSEPTIYGYTNNYLTSITMPLTGAVTSMTYDAVNRVKTRSDPESYTLTYSYDNLDRVTQIAYSGAGTDTFSYVNPATGNVDLDLHSSTDRLGRTTNFAYNIVRQLTSITDPRGHKTLYGWCSCGALTSIIDPNSRTTTFVRDLESRVTSKVYSGGMGTVNYGYDTAVGLLSTSTDAKQDVSTYSYNPDNTLSGVSYALGAGSTAVLPPSPVAYSYDGYYNRLTSIGGISLSYVPAGSLGGGKPLTVTNTLTSGSAAVTYTYDEWGRVVGRNLDGANSQTISLDSLGRVTNVLNLLAPTSPGFAYSYFDPTHPTNRVGGITYPNGQSVAYNYFGNSGDERLQEIKNLTPASAILSKNDYTYNAVGDILTWQQQTDSNTPLLWTDGYDTADQLISAVETNTAITSPALHLRQLRVRLRGQSHDLGSERSDAEFRNQRAQPAHQLGRQRKPERRLQRLPQWPRRRDRQRQRRNRERR